MEGTKQRANTHDSTRSQCPFKSIHVTFPNFKRHGWRLSIRYPEGLRLDRRGGRKVYHYPGERFFIDRGERKTTDLIKRHPKGFISFVLRGCLSESMKEWLRIPNLNHVCQEGLIVDDQALLGRLLRKPQATRIDLGNAEWLGAAKSSQRKFAINHSPLTT